MPRHTVSAALRATETEGRFGSWLMERLAGLACTQ